MNKKIVLLCSECFSTTVLYNHINSTFPVPHIIIEEPMRGMALAKRRFKKLGFFRTAGQILFSLVIVRLVKMGSGKRVKQIVDQYKFNESAIPEDKKTKFSSANDAACIEFLQQVKPDIVLVNGTRILSKRLLESVNATFINMHTGITPQYRGVHGGYWAVVNNDYERCGVTIHLVDKGIDTGAVLYQTKINVTPKDNFVTYPYLQFGEGVPLVAKAVQDVTNNSLKSYIPSGDKGKLWYHPTIWQYLYYRIFKNKK